MNWFANLFTKKNRKRKPDAFHPEDPLLYISDTESNQHHSHSNGSFMPSSHHHDTSHYDSSSHNSDTSGFDFGGHH